MLESSWLFSGGPATLQKGLLRKENQKKAVPLRLFVASQTSKFGSKLVANRK
jgi:hypothetical protein